MVELVIKIDENVFTRLFDNGIKDNEIAIDDICEMARALRMGIPLSKGHGVLKDADAMINKLCTHEANEFFESITCAEILDFINDEKPIIEADKEYEAKVITRGNCMMCGKELTDGLFFCKECEDKENKRKRLQKENTMDKWQKLKDILADGKEHFPKDVYVSRPSVFEEILDIMEELEKRELAELKGEKNDIKN